LVNRKGDREDLGIGKKAASLCSDRRKKKAHTKLTVCEGNTDRGGWGGGGKESTGRGGEKKRGKTV